MYTIVSVRPWGQAFVEDENTILISLDKLSSDYTFFANRKIKTEHGKWSKHDPTIIRSNGDLVIVYQPREDITEAITIYDGVTVETVEEIPTLGKNDRWLLPIADTTPTNICPFACKPWKGTLQYPAFQVGNKVTGDASFAQDRIATVLKYKDKPVYTHRMAQAVYQLGQATAIGHCPLALGHLHLSTTQELVDELAKKVPANTILPWMGTLADLEEIFQAGVARPCKQKDTTPGNTTPKPSLLFDRGDDVELGKHLATRLAGKGSDLELSEGESYRAAYDRNAVYRVTPRYTWEEVTPEQLYLHGMWYAGKMIAKPSEKNPNAMQPIHLSNARVNGILEVAKNLLHAHSPHHFDSAPRGLAVMRNADVWFLPIHEWKGKVSVGEIEPLSIDHRVIDSNVLPIQYDPAATCPLFWDFLESLFPNMDDEQRDAHTNCILQFVAMALLGVGPRYEKALVMLGDGGNGKSTLIKIIEQLFPKACRVAIPFDQFGDDTRRAMLVDAKINLCGELKGKGMLEGEHLKDIISGDEITARLLYKDAFTFRPRATHLVSCNKLPVSSDISYGFFRKLVVLKFSANFVGREDRTLADRIIATELPGVLNVVLQAANILLEHGIHIPEASVLLSQKWRCDSDSVAAWIEESTETGRGKSKTRDLRNHYKLWCEQNGARAVSEREFVDRLNRNGIKSNTINKSLSWDITPTHDLYSDPNVETLYEN